MANSANYYRRNGVASTIIHRPTKLSNRATHRRYNLLLRKNNSLVYDDYKHVLSSVFVVIFMFMFIMCYSYFIRHGYYIDFSFKSLIDYFSSMPNVAINFANVNLTIGGNWGIIDGLRQFLNLFTTLGEVSITFTGFIVQLLVVARYVLGLIMFL